MSLLDRNITTIAERLLLVAPASAVVPETFANVAVNRDRHSELIAEIQRLRGRVYLEDGAISPEQLTEGLHRTPEDNQSWHLVFLDKEGRVSACNWFLPHTAENVSFNSLRVRSCPLATSDDHSFTLRRAIESDITTARHAGFAYGELGGWAVDKSNGCATAGLLLALATYSLTQFLGGAICITTATVRHASSSILRRLGGIDLEWTGIKIPQYFDPHYSCDMELLRFDSHAPNRKYSSLVEQLRDQLTSVPVIAARALPQPVGAGFAGDRLEDVRAYA